MFHLFRIRCRTSQLPGWDGYHSDAEFIVRLCSSFSAGRVGYRQTGDPAALLLSPPPPNLFDHQAECRRPARWRAASKRQPSGLPQVVRRTARPEKSPQVQLIHQKSIFSIGAEEATAWAHTPAGKPGQPVADTRQGLGFAVTAPAGFLQAGSPPSGPVQSSSPTSRRRMLALVMPKVAEERIRYGCQAGVISSCAW